jgi:hypothetical protein
MPEILTVGDRFSQPVPGTVVAVFECDGVITGFEVKLDGAPEGETWLVPPDGLGVSFAAEEGDRPAEQEWGDGTRGQGSPTDLARTQSKATSPETGTGRRHQMDELIQRFSPDRLRLSGKFYAILGCLLGGQKWTEPSYDEIAVSEDGHVFGALPDGHSVHLAVVSDLEDNLRGVADTVGLTASERIRLATIISDNVTVHGDNFDPFEILGVSRPDPSLN